MLDILSSSYHFIQISHFLVESMNCTIDDIAIIYFNMAFLCIDIISISNYWLLPYKTGILFLRSVEMARRNLVPKKVLSKKQLFLFKVVAIELQIHANNHFALPIMANFPYSVHCQLWTIQNSKQTTRIERTYTHTKKKMISNCDWKLQHYFIHYHTFTYFVVVVGFAARQL